MFRYSFLDPSPCGVGSVDPEKGCLVAPGAAQGCRRSNPASRRPLSWNRPTCRTETKGFQRHPPPAPTASAPSPRDLGVLIVVEGKADSSDGNQSKRQSNVAGRETCAWGLKWRKSAQSSIHYLGRYSGWSSGEEKNQDDWPLHGCLV